MAPQKALKKRLEIHDFHETWLKNMEMYKERLAKSTGGIEKVPTSTFGVSKTPEPKKLQPEKKPSYVIPSKCRPKIVNPLGRSNKIQLNSILGGGKPRASNRPHRVRSIASGHRSKKDSKNKKIDPGQIKPNSPKGLTKQQLSDKLYLNIFKVKSPVGRYSKSLFAGVDKSKPIPLSYSRPLVNELNSPVLPNVRKGSDKNASKGNLSKSAKGSTPKKLRAESEKITEDINELSESESDENYISQPFYLNSDQGITKQSQDIRVEVVREDGGKNNDSTSYESQDPAAYFRPKKILSPSLFPNVAPYLNFSSHAEYGPHMPLALHKILKWKYSPYLPRIVKKVVLNSGFRIIKNTTEWMSIWERHMKSPGFRSIRSYQKYNHIPGTFRIGRKDCMWRSIQTNVKKFGSKEFGIMQKTYIMPEDCEMLRQAWPKNAAKLTKWIVKPPASARGTGIRIINKWSQFPKDRPLIVQKYIERPLLINDNKFDLRIYVVLTSVSPLRLYLYKNGLARFASIKYSSELTTLDDKYIHLTNYSVNKFSQNYMKNEDFNACQGHKWTLQSLWSCLEGQGINTKRLWATLRNLVIKAIITGESGINMTYQHYVNYRYNCYELFGFDILLDENLIPWLLEINISPSLHSEMPIDLHVKGVLVQAVLNTVLFQVPPKLSEMQQQQIRNDLHLDGPLCYDDRLFTTALSVEEKKKHTYFTNRSLDSRKDYLDKILEHLLPDDVRCLIIAEDEFNRCSPLERIFPTPDTHTYLKFMDTPRYYNRLLDAWEHKYGNNRKDGLKVLRRLTEDGYHLKVAETYQESRHSLHEVDISHLKVSRDRVHNNIFNVHKKSNLNIHTINDFYF